MLHAYLYGYGINNRATGAIPIAWDTFNRADQNLNASPSDSGNTWTAVKGQLNIVSNEVAVITTPFLYVMDSFTRQPKLVTIDIRDTDATGVQSGVITIRDAADDLNYIKISVFAGGIFITLDISEVVAGVATSKAQTVIAGDYRDAVNFYPLIITDAGGSITADASAIEPTAIITWGAAPAATSSGVGIRDGNDARLTNKYDNLVIRG
jgi:hypothetical protein